MRAYFSKQKDTVFVGENVVFDLDDELQQILLRKEVWSNIDLNDLFESYLGRMNLVNHFSGQETERDKISISKMQQLAKILREMLNASCYYAVFD